VSKSPAQDRAGEHLASAWTPDWGSVCHVHRELSATVASPWCRAWQRWVLGQRRQLWRAADDRRRRQMHFDVSGPAGATFAVSGTSCRWATEIPRSGKCARPENCRISGSVPRGMGPTTPSWDNGRWPDPTVNPRWTSTCPGSGFTKVHANPSTVGVPDLLASSSIPSAHSLPRIRNGAPTSHRRKRPRGTVSWVISAEPSKATFRLTHTTPRTPRRRDPAIKTVLVVGGVRHTESPWTRRDG